MKRPATSGHRGFRAWTAAPFLLVLLGCAGPQSTLDARGPVAAGIASAWWIMLVGALLILAVVMALVFYGVFREPSKRPHLAAVPFLAWAGVGLPLLILTALLIYGTDLAQRITEPADHPLKIEVTGHRWWWEVRYPAADGPEVVTANELRLPTAVPIELTLRSADVIHSFWIPNLGGKVDMIPGRTNTLRLVAGQAGSFRGQCSEFCGAQHAHMGLVVVAGTLAEFDQWRKARAAPAETITGPGLDRFIELGCDVCHSIAGTPATGSTAPTLTHIAGRPTLGGGAIRYSPAALRSWLSDHGHSLKPGSLGPEPRVLDAADVETLTLFLGQLR